MPRRSAETRRKILETAYDLFYRAGFMCVGIDRIAAAAGVTKRTLYFHFDSKDALMAAVLERQHTLTIERITRWANRHAGSPELALEVLFEDLRNWATKPGWHGSGFSRAAIELAAQPDHPARLAAGRHKAMVEGALAEMLCRCDLPATPAARRLMLLMEGAMTLALVHGDTSYFDEAAEAAKDLIVSYRQTGGSARSERPAVRGRQ